MAKIQEYFRNIFFVFSTFFLSPIFNFGIFFNKIKSRKEQLKILVIQRGKIGDLVCTTQVFRELKKKYPESFVAAMVTSHTKDVLKGNPYVDNIIVFDYQQEDSVNEILDVIKKVKSFNFHYSVSHQPDMFHSLIPFWAGIPERILSESYGDNRLAKILSIFGTRRFEFKENDLTFVHHLKLLEPIGVNSSNIKMDIFIDDSSVAKAEKFLKENGVADKDFLVGISPTAGNRFKEWESEKWTKLSDKIIEKLGAKIIFIGSEDDKNIISEIMSKMRNKAVDASGKFKIEEIAALLQKIKMFVSSINGVMHIADAVDVPIVAIAGPINFLNQPPMGKKKFIVWNVYCCQSRSGYIRTRRECSAGHRKCVKDISVEDVFSGVLHVKNILG